MYKSYYQIDTHEKKVLSAKLLPFDLRLDMNQQHARGALSLGLTTGARPDRAKSSRVRVGLAVGGG
jgi:hypothetical protein